MALSFADAQLRCGLNGDQVTVMPTKLRQRIDARAKPGGVLNCTIRNQDDP